MIGWVFTALKPPSEIDTLCIEYNGLEFSADTLSFYVNENADFPDEIDLTIVHRDVNEDNRELMSQGVFLYIDNFVGELNSVLIIDNIVISQSADGNELIPIVKLPQYLNWRQKEFVEKYEGVIANTQDQEHVIYEAQAKSGLPIIATINSEILRWDAKMSHPWILDIEIQYDGKNNNGLPVKEVNDLLYGIEDEIETELKDIDGYIYIGRESYNNVRSIYFACKDFRKPSRLIREISHKYKKQVPISYSIYKDKYWRSFSRYMQH
jgi:hypothetical protein